MTSARRDSPGPRRARAGGLDRRRLRRDRPRPHQRQPALGQQHADHQRRHARRARSPSISLRPHGGGVGRRLGDRQRDHRRARSPRWSQAADAAARAAVAGRGRQRAGRRRRRRRLGRRAASTPTSTCSTRSRPRSARRSAGPATGAGCSTASSTTRSPRRTSARRTGLRLRHVQPTGHFGCTGKTADLTQSAWVGGATRDFTDVDPLALDAELAHAGSAGATRRVDLPAGRYDTILPPTAVADLMIYAYWYAGARVAHEGQSVFSRPRRRHPDRRADVSDPGVHAVLRPGLPGLRVRAVRRRRASGNMSVGLRQRAAARPHRLDPRRRARPR